ncbi:hypothetical protein, partial [Aneurinibacillus sp. UBA3580]|uniref:hypothetical protein n=1 Tax=Aneurinibacillus sp. UBA3580 TaxID=1946041 RepID=UPI00258020A2
AARPFSTQKTSGRFVALRSDRQNIQVPRGGKPLPVFLSLKGHTLHTEKATVGTRLACFSLLTNGGKIHFTLSL